MKLLSKTTRRITKNNLKFFFPFLISLVYLFFSCNKDVTKVKLSLQEYTDQMNAIIVSDTSHTSGTTAKESILNSAEGYRKQWEKAKDIAAPSEVAALHDSIVAAIKYQYESNLDAGNNTPAGLAATIDNVNEFAHYRADVGYARDDESKANCNLKTTLETYNLTFNAIGFCGAVNLPRNPDSTLGSPTDPVTSVYILHDYIKDSSGNAFGRPNVDGFEINKIYAKANTPISITFDNRNGAPFVYSFSIYKSTAYKLPKDSFAGGSAPYSGVRAHQITISLSPGTYTYVDNVHPYVMRGTLIVVE